MTKGMTILYKVHNNLYVNLTNRCTCSCTFCLRNEKETVGESSTLWLEHEPSVEEVKKEFEKFNMDEYNEVVFCGFGEPTERIDDLIEIAKFVKEKTNGMDIVYGGGLKQDNAEMLASIDEIDGGLIALTRFQGEIGYYPEEYLEIIRLYMGRENNK